MKDYFVSYTGVDVDRATWIAEILEKEGYTVTIQAWDFRPGDNFVAKINEALIECRKLVVVLSNTYLESDWCEVEWTSKYAEQILSKETRIIPIMIEPVILKGILSSIVYINIVDKTEEEARSLILDGLKANCERISKGFSPFYNAEHKEIHIDYFVEEDQIIYIKTCKSKVLISNKNKIHNRITWFADEEIEIFSLTDGVEIEKLDIRDTNLNYNVVYDRLLEKGEEIEFKIKAVLSNKNKHFANFFSTEVITPIKSLSMHLNSVEKGANKIYTQKIASSLMNVRTEVPQEYNFSLPFHWKIDNPELNFEYKIFW